MAELNRTILVPYDDYKKLTKDSADKASVIELLDAEFPDETCRIIAIKSVVGYVPPQPEPEPDPDPEPEPEPEPTPDPEPEPEPEP